jgi:hypothetical protein
MDVQIALKLPIFQNSLERCTYISTCFSNLKTAANPIHEDFEKYLLEGLIDELNNLFPMGLSTDFVCDRFMDSDVFDDHLIDRTVRVLIGVSQLKKLPRFIQQEVSQVFDMTTPGWLITDAAVQEKITKIEIISVETDIGKAVAVLQLYDNMVGVPVKVKHLVRVTRLATTTWMVHLYWWTRLQ